mmetsp:Transcript_27441/g.57276  ORF Transcript_27441/g.57276 Transcript_27441/m.57276 type:complete len:97 (-) Transcript_27441:399-689(-)
MKRKSKIARKTDQHAHTPKEGNCTPRAIHAPTPTSPLLNDESYSAGSDYDTAGSRDNCLAAFLYTGKRASSQPEILSDMIRITVDPSANVIGSQAF